MFTHTDIKKVSASSLLVILCGGTKKMKLPREIQGRVHCLRLTVQLLCKPNSYALLSSQILRNNKLLMIATSCKIGCPSNKVSLGKPSFCWSRFFYNRSERWKPHPKQPTLQPPPTNSAWRKGLLSSSEPQEGHGMHTVDPLSLLLHECLWCVFWHHYLISACNS